MYKDTWLMLLNSMYRSLILTGRAYAAFRENEVQPLFECFNKSGNEEIFDPMSGYGTLVSMSAKYGFDTYCVEMNAPSYLWQVLTSPHNIETYLHVINQVSNKVDALKSNKILSEASDDWFTEYGKSIIHDMYRDIYNSLVNRVNPQNTEIMSLALLLPFVSRLSCSINNDSSHIKRGGLCIYKNYQDHYKAYLNRLINPLLICVSQNYNGGTRHTTVFGDCSKVDLPKARFSNMITSPPYPNRSDYAMMFAPENCILEWFIKEKIVYSLKINNLIIGTNSVNGRKIGDVNSKSANEFMDAIFNYKGSIKAMKDNKGYYFSYYKNYFSDLENAYISIEPSLCRNFEGFIIVSNNTARNFVIPVDKAVIETWHSLGFEAEIFSSIEKSHIGAKNPKAKGFKARHMEYVIRVWRNDIN